jgi:biopolymer transport protein ExbD
MARHYNAHLAIHEVQVAESIHLSEQSRQAIDRHVKEAAQEQSTKKWNELRMKLKRDKPTGYDYVLLLMDLLDAGGSVR